MGNSGNVRMSIVISPEEHKLLILWAKFHGKSKSAYANQIIGARVEANASKIMELVAIAAQQNGISTEEQISAWLNEDSNENQD